mmetsp:Transcript_4226/g.8593  ORF Transcript_4226/g.8593 Transcript_4226/m.8593 type:complete len:201 (-) Transcript_4226:202-804(-)
MSTPVVTSTWAGNFDCDFCRRKRLMGEEFSKKALEKYRKTGGPLKCKQCVQAAETAEREAAAKKRATAASASNNSSGAVAAAGNSDHSAETRVCAKCQVSLTFDQYNKNQWNKGPGQSKCRPCVEASLAAEQAQQAQGKADNLAAAKERLAAATTMAERVAAESEVAALEAQQVTGLQPVRLGKGRGGRGRGRGRGGGRK